LTRVTVVSHFVDRPPILPLPSGRRLFQRLATGGIDFAPTIFSPTSGPRMLDEARLAPIHGLDDRLWIKSGDLRAARPDDAVAIAPAAIGATLQAFAARGVPWAAVQKHVPGPVVRFHASTGGHFFRWYLVDVGPQAARPLVDVRAIERLIAAIGDRLGLETFGGDLVLASPARPVLVDLDDGSIAAAARGDAAPPSTDRLEATIAPG
jgi:hypothetical protein